jgi:hypothetical protein
VLPWTYDSNRLTPRAARAVPPVVTSTQEQKDGARTIGKGR